MKPTKLEITNAIKELETAMLEAMEADIAVENAFLRKQKAQKKLLLAKDEIREIRFTY